MNYILESETCSVLRKQMDELQKQRSASYCGYFPSLTGQSSTNKPPSFEQDDSDDDEFITPASSPTSPTQMDEQFTSNNAKSPETNKQSANSSNKSDLETALSRKLYERDELILRHKYQ